MWMCSLGHSRLVNDVQVWITRKIFVAVACHSFKPWPREGRSLCVQEALSIWRQWLESQWKSWESMRCAEPYYSCSSTSASTDIEWRAVKKQRVEASTSMFKLLDLLGDLFEVVIESIKDELSENQINSNAGSTKCETQTNGILRCEICSSFGEVRVRDLRTR